MKLFRTILTLALAFLVLLASTSFMVGMHICMGEVRNVALFTKAEGCEREQRMPPCHRHLTAPCCEDEAVIHKADDFKASTGKIQLVAPAPVTLEQPLVLISEIIPVAPVSRTQYYNYDPPLRSCDLTVEHRVFLI